MFDYEIFAYLLIVGGTAFIVVQSNVMNFRRNREKGKTAGDVG